jgi:quercetin dioxygenase-like cupin family protein
MHYFGSFDERALAPHPVFDGHSSGYTHADLINHRQGSVHHGLSIDELAAGGSIDVHLHSFEEGFYILTGTAEVTINGARHALKPGDYAAIKVGTPHGWRNTGASAVRWLQMHAPQPKPGGAERDTFFPRDGGLLVPNAPVLVGHFDVSMIPPVGQRTSAGAGLETVFLKWLIDFEFGARHHRLVFIEYQPGAAIALHDHTFEEAYFILSGEVEATADGQKYRARAGDVVWTGVGCVHSFANIGSEPVRWLETFSPQPPQENVFRFMAEWEKKAVELEGEPT